MLVKELGESATKPALMILYEKLSFNPFGLLENELSEIGKSAFTETLLSQQKMAFVRHIVF